MSVVLAAMRGVSVDLLTTTTTGTSSAIAVSPSYRQHSMFIKGTAGVSAGAVQPESADAADYSGTWNPIGGPPITVVAGAEIQVQFDGVFRFIRARVTTDVTGTNGNVSVSYIGDKP